MFVGQPVASKCYFEQFPTNTIKLYITVDVTDVFFTN